MPFLFLGLLILLVGMYFLRQAKRSHDHEGEIGCKALIAAGIILILIQGLFFRSVILLGF
ncbi:hypothetical protein A2856_00370 [Candidatus Uhrbacteria bacterium RIFCSPHIGHO2_01_FULL_63_20]|uniref:Uncharacterized protein n=1 Tax=Candidatus Uhrbacteria bacterium RIFCSPHIGHO2_01_FULL_63_20 TaxID=1802385 RepID=A0A1F7TLS8_9BACT|nr:MAG: hypothetical protein A2856_00370 [Candidatus Uhrbacteria bacterium RIFCSPHIGHO2_01_FULL_63_20]